MKISIIVTNYNYRRFLPAVVESIITQSPDELIIVDDGSTDGSKEWLKQWQTKALVIFKNNGGQASAMNMGFAASTGDLVWFIDADDVLLPGAIDAVRVNVWEEISKVHLRCRIINADGDLGRWLPRKWLSLPTGDLRTVYGYLGFYPSVPTSGNVYTRKFLERLMPIPEGAYRICADAYLHDLAPGGGEIGAISKPLVGYRHHSSNNFAGQDVRTDYKWLACKVQRLDAKWRSIQAFDRRPRWLVRVGFVLSPDYLRTIGSLRSSTEFRTRGILQGNAPGPGLNGSFMRCMICLLGSPSVLRIYARLWLLAAGLVYFLRSGGKLSF